MCGVQPRNLKRELRRRIKFDESIEKDLKGFIKVLNHEAVNCEVYGNEKSEKEIHKHTSDKKPIDKGAASPEKTLRHAKRTPRSYPSVYGHPIRWTKKGINFETV